jgi:hypothetical protein
VGPELKGKADAAIAAEIESAKAVLKKAGGACFGEYLCQHKSRDRLLFFGYNGAINLLFRGAGIKGWLASL